MTSLTEHPAVTPSLSVTNGRSDLGLAPLDSQIYREHRFCSICDAEEEFRTVLEFVGGRIGVCMGCGDEKVIPFSRVTEAQ
jgi:hypothetical protein